MNFFTKNNFFHPVMGYPLKVTGVLFVKQPNDAYGLFYRMKPDTSVSVMYVMPCCQCQVILCN